MTTQTGSTQLSALLTNLNEQGGFSAVVLTDRQGFPIAFADTPDQDTHGQAAVVALIQKTAGQVRDLLSMAQTDEISLYDTTGQRLVCRPFSVNGHDMLLAIVVPNKNQSYRRLSNKMVNAIRKQWNL